jgi:enamine deaminase RidA (YjgF/YER057c/UK114 family)
MNLTARLAQLGLTLPKAPRPVAAYVPANISGNLLFVSGQLPFRDEELLAKGPVPTVISVERAIEASRQCGLNALAVAVDALEGLGGADRLARVVRVGVWVQSDARFAEQPKIANGASQLMVDVFGDAGKHARAAVGSIALPLDASVEVEVLFELR